EQHVVEPPVGGQGGQPTFVRDDEEGRLLPGRLDEPAQRASTAQVPPGIEQDHIRGRRVQQRCGFRLRNFDVVGKELQRRQYFRGGTHIVGEHQQGGHIGLLTR